jgi:hypothetical protein
MVLHYWSVLKSAESVSLAQQKVRLPVDQPGVGSNLIQNQKSFRLLLIT